MFMSMRPLVGYCFHGGWVGWVGGLAAGRKVDFRQTIIVMTSNLGASLLSRNVEDMQQDLDDAAVAV